MDYKTLVLRSRKLIEKNNQEEKVVFMLLEHVLNKELSYILANQNNLIEEEKLELFSELLSEYVIDEKPIEYILGYTYFYGLKLKVNSSVLIPRKETEEVVEKAIEVLKNRKNLTIVDVGCGSGNISIALGKHLDIDKIYAVDISEDILDVAKENAKSNNVNIEFINSNVLDYLIENNLKVDVIISNPPYIEKDYQLAKSVYDYEPHSALFAKEKGIEFYKKILISSREVINKNGLIIFEIGFNQKELITELIEVFYPNCNYSISKDFSGNERIVVIETK